MKLRNPHARLLGCACGKPDVRGMWCLRAQQEKEHAVSPDQLRNDVQKSATTRQANEAGSSPNVTPVAGREALKVAEWTTRRWKQAISQGE